MGYYISLDDANFVIPAENEAEALARLRAINEPEFDAIKSGGSWGGGSKSQSWYSWMSEDWHKTAKTTAEVFEHLGFETEAGADDAGTRLIGYDSKTGQEGLFLYIIRDLVAPGSYLRFTGEDGGKYEYAFRDGEMFTREGGWSVTEPQPVRVKVYSFGTGNLYANLTADPEVAPEEIAVREQLDPVVRSAFALA